MSSEENEFLDATAKQVTEAFFASEPLAHHIQEYLVKHQPSPASVAFAGLLIDKIMRQQIPNWEKLRAFAIRSWNEMEQLGIIKDLEKLGEDA